MYFSSKNNASQQIYTSLTYEIHLVKGLKANLLISNDIISLKNFIIDIKKKSVFIKSCNITVPIDARQRRQFLTRKLLIGQETMVSPYSEAMVLLIYLPLPNNCDFLFHSITQAILMLFIYLVNHQTSKVLVRKNTNQMLHISKYHKLGHLIDIAYKNYFFANIYSTFDMATSLFLLQNLFDHNISPFFFMTNFLLKIVLSNRVRVYKNKTAIKQIVELVAKYLTIWESQGFVQILSER